MKKNNYVVVHMYLYTRICRNTRICKKKWTNMKIQIFLSTCTSCVSDASPGNARNANIAIQCRQLQIHCFRWNSCSTPIHHQMDLKYKFFDLSAPQTDPLNIECEVFNLKWFKHCHYWEAFWPLYLRHLICWIILRRYLCTWINNGSIINWCVHISYL